MEAHETSEANQASGNSIFWALVALALNATTEPSRISSFFRKRSGPGVATNPSPGFNPLRSSPVLCAAETILDMFFFILERIPRETLSSSDSASDTPRITGHRYVGGGQNPHELSDAALNTAPQPEPNTDNTVSSGTTLKILAFFLGVLPQALKLFSMKGIVGTQICAATFLAASVTRAISKKSSSRFSSSIDIPEKNMYTVPILLLLLLTSFGLPVFCIWVYFHIAGGLLSETAATAAGDRPNNILFELATFAKSLYMLFALLTIIFNLACRRSLPTAKWFPLIVWMFLPSQDASTTRTESGAWIGRPPFWLRTIAQAPYLMILSLVGCLQVSALCIASGRMVSRLAAKRAARSDGHSADKLPTTSTNAGEPRSTGRFHVIDTLRQGMLWLKATLVGLCKAVDHHGEWLGTWHEGFGMTTEELVLGCGIFNLLTALLYYLVVFDSTGTSSPLWTSALG